MGKHRNINPYDTVDLVFQAESFNDDIGTLYVRANVYDPNGTEITDSPFVLTKIAGTEIYVNRGAFQADVDSGTYIVRYQPYSDAGYTTKSEIIGQQVETITVKIQSTTGLGGSVGAKGGDVIVDMDQVEEILKQILKEQKEAKKRQQEIIKKMQVYEDKEISVAIPDDFNNPIRDDLTIMRGMITAGFNKNTAQFNLLQNKDFWGNKYNNLVVALNKIYKENKNIKINNYLDKIKENNDSQKKEITSKIEAGFSRYDGLAKKELESVNREFERKGRALAKKIKDDFVKNSLSIFNSLDESIRKKLKYTVDVIKMASGRNNKVDINIKKDD